MQNSSECYENLQKGICLLTIQTSVPNMRVGVTFEKTSSVYRVARRQCVNLNLLELELQIGGVFKVQTEKYVTN